MTPFTCTIYEDKYNVCAHYKVVGFWPHEVVSVSTYVLTDHKGIHKWTTPRINWSTGGYDPKEEPDFITAASNFAAALNDAVTLAREWKAKYTDQNP